MTVHTKYPTYLVEEGREQRAESRESRETPMLDAISYVAPIPIFPMDTQCHAMPCHAHGLPHLIHASASLPVSLRCQWPWSKY